MFSKIMMFILILFLFLQIKFINGFFINFKINKESFEIELKDIQKNEKLIRKLEENILQKLPKVKLNLENLFKNQKFENEKNINYFNKKNLLFVYLKAIQKNLNDFKKNFELIKELKLWGVDKFIKFDDFRNFVNIIEEFLIQNEEITENYLSNPNNINSKSNYKNYIDELKLNLVNETFKNNLNNIYFYINFKLDINRNQILSIINKIQILRKMNEFKNNSEHYKGKNLKFNYKKIYFNEFINNVSKINFNIENVEILLNEDMIEKFEKLVEILNKLKNKAEYIDNLKNKKIKSDILEIIDSYEKVCKEFLNSLNSFFILFNDKTENKKSYSYRDYGFLSFLNMFKVILLQSKNDYKTDINFIFEMFLGTDEINEIIFLNIIEDWFNILYNNDWFGNFIFIMNEINNICIKNNYIFSEKNNLKFQEYLSEELNDILQKFNNIIQIIFDYLNTKELNKKKEMEIIILEKLVFFSSDLENNEEENILILMKSNIKYFIDILYKDFNYNCFSTHTIKQYEILLLVTIFKNLSSVTFYIYKKIDYLFNNLMENKDIPCYIKNLYNFIRLLPKIFK